MNYYTTFDLTRFTPYKSRRTLLQALHNNQKKEPSKRDRFLSSLWGARFRFGKTWVFEKSKINKILLIKNGE